jgi:hypothetical protein
VSFRTKKNGNRYPVSQVKDLTKNWYTCELHGPFVVESGEPPQCPRCKIAYQCPYCDKFIQVRGRVLPDRCPFCHRPVGVEK